MLQFMLAAILSSSLGGAISSQAGAPPVTKVAFLRFDETDQRILDRLEPGGTVIVFSPGGDPLVAAQTSDWLLSNFDRVDIAAFCLSSCAEILVRKASIQSKLHFREMPIVGFHHNSLIFGELVDEEQKLQAQRCFRDTDTLLAELIRGSNGSLEIVEIQMEKLGSTRASVSLNAGSCEGRYVAPTHNYWLPTSSQLRALYGLGFTGSVCADSFECLTEKLPQFGKKGQSFVAAGRTYRLVENDGAIEVKVSAE